MPAAWASSPRFHFRKNQSAFAPNCANAASSRNCAISSFNRPATCRKFYIHPAVLAAYADGTLMEIAAREVGIEAAEASPFAVWEQRTLALLAENGTRMEPENVERPG